MQPPVRHPRAADAGTRLHVHAGFTSLVHGQRQVVPGCTRVLVLVVTHDRVDRQVSLNGARDTGPLNTFIMGDLMTVFYWNIMRQRKTKTTGLVHSLT